MANEPTLIQVGDIWHTALGGPYGDIREFLGDLGAKRLKEIVRPHTEGQGCELGRCGCNACWSARLNAPWGNTHEILLEEIALAVPSVRTEAAPFDS